MVQGERNGVVCWVRLGRMTIYRRIKEVRDRERERGGKEGGIVVVIGIVGITSRRQGCGPPQDPVFAKVHPFYRVTGFWVRLGCVDAYLHTTPCAGK